MAGANGFVDYALGDHGFFFGGAADIASIFIAGSTVIAWCYIDIRFGCELIIPVCMGCIVVVLWVMAKLVTCYYCGS